MKHPWLAENETARNTETEIDWHTCARMGADEPAGWWRETNRHNSPVPREHATPCQEALELATLRAANRALADRLAALTAIADQSGDMEYTLLRARAAGARPPHHTLQPLGAAPSARELAWDMVRTFYLTGAVPPASAFVLWTRLPSEDWVRLEADATTVHRLSYAIYRSTPQPTAEMETFIRNAFSLRFLVMDALAGAPRGYLAAVFAASAAAAETGDDAAAVKRRVAAVADAMELNGAQRGGLRAAWTTFQATMASVAGDEALFQDILSRGGLGGAEEEAEGQRATSRLAAPTKAIQFLSAATAAEALSICNERRLTAFLALAWAAHEHLGWRQYMELFNVVGRAPFDYIHVYTTLLAQGGGGGDGCDGSEGCVSPATSAASAVGDGSSGRSG